MTDFTHLFVWEIRRSRALVIVWLLLIAANATQDAAWPTLAARLGTYQLVGTIGNLMAIAEMLLTVVIIARVVHADALVGTRAFWLTRPIRPATLLTAKLAFLGATLIVPKIVIEAGLMAIYQVPLPDVIGVSLQSALLLSLWITVLMIAAAMTANFATFALLIGSALVALAVTIAVLIAITTNRLSERPALAANDVVLYDPTPDMVATAAILLAALVVVAAQYATRRRAPASAVAAAGLLVTYVVGSTWRWPLLAPAVMTPAWASSPAMLALAATGDTVTIERGMWIRDQPVEWKEARAQIRLRGLEPGWTAAVALRQALLQIPGKAEPNNSFAAHPSTVIVDDHAGELQDREVMRRLLDVSTLIDERSQERGENAILMFVRGTDLARLAPAQGAYEGQFEVALRRHVIEGVIPLRPGAGYQSGPYRLLIRSIQVESGHVSLVTGESNAVSVFARRPQTMRTLYLRNRRVSQAIPGSSFPIRADMTLLRVLPFTIGLGAGEPSGFSIEALAADFPPNYARRAVIDFDEAWIRDAEVVVVKSTQEGSVSRELTISDFPIR